MDIDEIDICPSLYYSSRNFGNNKYSYSLRKADMPHPDSDHQQNLNRRIATWKAGLADLGRRNPLIKFRQDSPRSLEILTTQPEILFQHLMKEKKVLYLKPDTDVQSIVQSTRRDNIATVSNPAELKTRQTGNEQLKRLKKLRGEARLSLEERGINSLFLAFGTLTWYDNDKPTKDKPSEALTSPLILVPVSLTKERGKDIHTISIVEEDIVLNPTLALKLKQTFGITFPEEELLQGITYSEIISQIRTLLVDQEKWQIQENIFLSLFSYAKAAMIKDIIENEARICNHPILQAISGDIRSYQAGYKEPMPASALDVRVKPDRTFQILDADSSQQVVIEAVKASSSLVVQGPPGTGKSQTIVNMIAELVGNGKSVLLVAEKDTALRVVYQRMVECGLNHLCLNLHHSGTTDKRKLVEDLSKTIKYIDGTGSLSRNSHDNFFSQLISTRQSIASYLESLYAKEQPLDKSPFELFGELLKKKREEVSDINVILSNFNQWSPSKLQEANKLLNQLSKFIPFLYGERTTVWSKTGIGDYSYELELELREKLEEFQQAIDLTQTINEQLQSLLQIESLSNLESIETCYIAFSHVLKAPMKLPVNWTEANISTAQTALAKLKADLHTIENFEPRLKQKYSSELFSPDLSKLSERYQKYSDFWFIRMFDRSYENDIKRLNKLCISTNLASHHELKLDLAQAVRVKFVREELNKSNYPARQVFGSLFNPQLSHKSELKPLEESLSWLIGLQQYSLPSNFVQQVVDSPSHRQKLNQIIQQLESSQAQIKKGLDFLLSYFSENDIIDRNLLGNQIYFADLKNFLNIAQSDLSHFQDWLTYKTTREELKNLGADNFTNALSNNRIDSQLWFPVLEKIIYQTYLNAILTRRPELKNFDFEVHERQIMNFATLDYNQLNIARERLKQIHTERWQGEKNKPAIQTEMSRLNREVNKKKQHLSIRKLLSDTTKGVPKLVKVLKPCWMMSPLSVSQYIDPNVTHFDVVIFDEASQLRTEDVVSSIIRSDRVVVIGDRKQLPPTSFFSTGDSAEDTDEEDDASYESILDECSNFMFGHTLKWHYRSQDERLIAFSNLHFYESQLVTFPNPVQNPDLGVFFKHVPDGVYDRGGRTDNRIEAMTVAQLTLEHIQRVPNQSLGIIAFSEAQANAIQEQIEILGKDYPELEEFCSDGSTQFFLKALENVQGDERDVILLSIGYARDAQGKLSLNFGPLNKRGGERRLNVAVTRAKNKITLVSSILASDIDLTRTSSEGVKLLRNYLDYAASGGKRLQGNSYTDELHFDSPFEEDVYHALKHHPSLQQYTIRTQVGCSGYRIDLAIAHNNRPGEFLLGIECDGASYHSSPTARDRDRLRQQILEKLGWKIHRIWSTEWFRNKPEQVRLLVKKIQELQ
jgi:very-short-patch-repair endonuclease/DNA polymerase III delta prime subunit